MKVPTAEKRPSPVLRTIAICFVCSGATALIYEVLWARMLGLVFGATTIAISAVLTAFMGGLAIGSAVAGKFVNRLRQPLRAYAFIEMAIGLYALLVPILFRAMDGVYAGIWQSFHPGFYAFAFVRLLLAATVLTIPTGLMGATLPLLVSAVRKAGDSRATSVARLYGLNLLGAIIGAVLAGFFLLPSFGVSKSIWIAAITNLLIGLAAFVTSRRAEDERVGVLTPVDPNRGLREEMRVGRAFWILCAFVSGVVTISMQVVWSRVLTMIIGSSTYAFTIVLTLFLVGLAAGAWIISRKTRPEVSSLRRWIVWIQLLTAGSLFLSFRLTNYVPAWLITAGFRFGVHSWLGLLTMQLLAAAALILVPTILMGMMMPLVLTWAGHGDGNRIQFTTSSAKLVAQLYAVNTIGSIFGALVTAFVLIPMTSTRFSVFCAAASGLAVAAVAFEPKKPAADRAVARAGAIGSAAILIVIMLLVWPPLNLNALSAGAYDSFVRVLAKTRGVPEERPPEQPRDHRLLMYTEGRTATVAVRRDWGIVSISINGRTNGSDADDMPTQVLAGQLGLLVAPRTDNALMIGFATGVSVGSALQSPIKSVDCVELEPAAVASSDFFSHVNNHPFDDPRLHVIIDDARTLLRVNPQKYDLIMSEPSHPWVPGVTNLFTREFFTLGRERLNDDGLFVQWVQIYQLSTESLRSVLATFNEVFPHVAVFRVQGAAKGKDLILLGSQSPIDLSHIDERMKDARVAADLGRVGLQTPNDVRAWFVCDETRLRPAVGGAIINTDDNMHVETAAPREAFRPEMGENSAWIERLRPPN